MRNKKITDGVQLIDALRKIVDNKQCAKLNGTLVDLYSASAVVKVFDGLTAENQEKFKTLSVARMAQIAFKLVA